MIVLRDMNQSVIDFIMSLLRNNVIVNQSELRKCIPASDGEMAAMSEMQLKCREKSIKFPMKCWLNTVNKRSKVFGTPLFISKL